jgi:hypothetical protein
MMMVTGLTVGAMWPSAVSAMGNQPLPPVCSTTVTLENCQVYLTSDGYCESLVKTQCQQLVNQAHEAERAAITTTAPVLPAGQELSNTPVTAKYVKDTKADHYLNGVDGMYVGNNISGDLGVAQNKPDRLNPALDNECTRAAAAAGNPNQICSCTQYAYDTYYSARPFEAKVHEKGLDYRALFNETQSVANTSIVSKDGLNQTSFAARQDARTKFHALDSYRLTSEYPPNTPASDKYAWDPVVRAAYDRTYKPVTWSAQKHRDMSAALAAYPDEKLNYLYDQQQAFGDLLAFRNARFKAYQERVKKMTVGSAEYVAAGKDAAAELKALDAELDQGLLHGKNDLGCVPANINDVNACDWSPKLFYKESQGYVSTLGEDRFQQCVQLTGDYFGNTPASALANTMAFSTHLTNVAKTPSALSAVSSDIDSLPTLGQQFSDEGQYGNNDFNVKYDYHFAWGITDFDQKDENGNSLFCKSNLRGGGTFNASGTVFGQTREAVDFDVWAYTKTEDDKKDYVHEELSMRVLGKDIFTPINAKQQANYSFVKNYSTKLGKNGDGYSMSKTFVVLAVPVTVKAGMTGNFGVDIALQGGIIRDCVGAPDQMNIGVDSKVKPYVDLDAYLSAGVGWDGLSAGVKGEVNLLEAELPFTANAGLNFQATNSGADLFLVAKSDLDLNLRTLGGKVSVYVEYLIGSSEKEIFSWNGYELKSNLFSMDAKYPLIQVAHMPVQPAVSNQ